MKGLIRQLSFKAALFTIFLCIVLPSAYSQEYSAGINTENPNPNAVLHLVSPNNNQGLMVPKLTTPQRTNLSSSLGADENGLMVYDSELDLFYFWSNPNWIAISTTSAQNLSLAGSVLSIDGGNSVDLSTAESDPTVPDNIKDGIDFTELSSVPTGLADGDDVDDADADPSNEIELPSQTGADAGLFLQADGSGGVSYVSASVTELDGDPTNEIELPTQSGTDAGLFLQADGAGNVSYVADNVNDADADATNEIELPSQTGVDAGLYLQADGSGGVTYSSVTVTEVDGDPTNEIELPSQTGADAGLFLQADGVGGVSYVAEADGDATNEIELPSQTGADTGLYLQADGSGGVAYSTVTVSEVDGDPTNEIELPTQSGTDAGLFLQADGAGNVSYVADNVNDADADATNEIELPSQTGTDTGLYLQADGSGGVSYQPAAGSQDLDFTGGIISISDDPTPTTVDLSAYDTNESDDITTADLGTGVGQVLSFATAGTLPALDGNALTNLPDQLPNQTGNTGFFLTTDGTVASWASSIDTDDQDLDFTAGVISISGDPTPTTIDLSAYDTNESDDITTADLGTGVGQVLSFATAGTLPALDGNALTNLPDQLPNQTGNTGFFLTTDGTVASWASSIDTDDQDLDFTAGVISISGDPTPTTIDLSAYDTNESDDITTADLGTGVGQVLSFATAGTLPALDGNALTNLPDQLPNQTGNTGFFLTTDGTVASWASSIDTDDQDLDFTAGIISISGDPTPTTIDLSAYDTNESDDITTADLGTGVGQVLSFATAGTLPALDGNALTNLPDQLPNQTGNTGFFLTTDGTVASWASSIDTDDQDLDFTAGVISISGDPTPTTIDLSAYDTNESDDITTADLGTGVGQVLSFATAGTLPALDGNALTNLPDQLPNQTGNTGFFLTTDGTVASWASSIDTDDQDLDFTAGVISISGDPTPTTIDLSAYDTNESDDITTADLGTGVGQVLSFATAGTLPALDGNALTNLPDQLPNQTGNTGFFLTTDGTVASWATAPDDQDLNFTAGVISISGDPTPTTIDLSAYDTNESDDITTADLGTGIGQVLSFATAGTLPALDGNALTNLPDQLPNQTGNTGFFLTTDGTVASWATAPDDQDLNFTAGVISISGDPTPTTIDLSAYDTNESDDITTADLGTGVGQVLSFATAGTLPALDGNALTNLPDQLPNQTGNTGFFLTTDGTVASWATAPDDQDLNFTAGVISISGDPTPTTIDLSAYDTNESDDITTADLGTGIGQVLSFATAGTLPALDGNALTNLPDQLPNQTGNTGFFLTTDGTVASWATAPDDQDLNFTAGVISISGDPTPTTIDLSAYDTNESDDITTADLGTGVGQVLSFATAGTLPALDGNALTNLPDQLPNQTGNTGFFLTTDGTVASWATAPDDQDLNFTAGVISISGDPTPTTIDLSAYDTNESDDITTADLGTGVGQVLSFATAGTLPALDGNALTNLPDQLPNQTGNTGFFLTTDGTVASWATAPDDQDLNFTAGVISISGDPTPTTIDLSAYDTNESDDITTADLGTGVGQVLSFATAGTLPALDGNALTNLPDQLPNQTGNTGFFLTTDGTVASWATAPDDQDLNFTAGVISISGDPTPTTIDLSAYDTNESDDITTADLGTGVGQVLSFATAGTLPALDGNALTNLPAEDKADDLITLSGLAANSTDLGIFGGTTITDNSSVLGALQDLESAVEAVPNFSTLNSVPKGDGAGGLIASDIFSDGTNQVTIGIPTTLPNVKFAVVNQSTNLNFGGANFSDTPGQGANFAVLRSRGTPGGEGVLQSNDEVGVYAFNVWDGTSDFVSVASMTVEATSNHLAGSDYGSQFTIATISDGNSSEQDRIRIQNDGTIVLNDNTTIGAGPTTGAKLQISPDNGQVNALRINPEGGGSNTGELQFMDLGTNFVGFKAPNTVTTNVVWALPDQDGGLDDVLATDGSGELYWRTPGVFDSDLEFLDGAVRTIYVAQPSTGPGDDLIMHAGDAATSSGDDGGDLYLSGGLQDGAGAQGEVFIDGPTTIGAGSPVGASFFFDSGIEYNNTTVTATTVQGDGSIVSVSKASGTIGSENTVTGGDNLGSFAWLGYDGTNYEPAAFISGTALEDYSSTGYGANLLVHTVPLGGTSPSPIAEFNDGGITVFQRGGNSASVTIFSDNGNLARISTPTSLPGDMDFILPPSEGANGETLTSDGSGGTYWASSASFNAANEVPRGDGGGQVSSNIFSDGASVLVGSNDFSLGQNFGVVNEGSPLRTAFVNYSSTAADDAPSLGFVRARGTSAIPASPTTNDRLGAIEFNTYISSITDAAQITVNATENHNPNGGVEMLFRTTANGQNSPQDRMRIDEAGDVEIANSLILGPLSIDNSGNLSAAGNADFGDVTLRQNVISVPDPTIVDADATLVAPSDHRYVRVTSGGGGVLNEIVGGADGQEIILVNIGAGDVLIETLGSAGVNILLNNDAIFAMTPRSTLHLMYVGGAINNWIEIGRSVQP